ncbi:MAG: COQ9 family protein [Magnetovibrio sp.]|nr:COQ9 family protein [Magnetovibrio sp.]
MAEKTRNDDLDTRRDRIVEAALAHVPFDGWSWKALQSGAADAGYDGTAAKRAFPGGLAEAADHFALWSDRRMLAALAEMDLDAMRVRERIHACVKTRLLINTPYKEALRRLLSFLSLPQNARLTARMTWRTCSEMWYAAGDTSTDWNHYSKRGLLASVYTSTILYWLADTGDGAGDFPDTWGFLDRRIDDVLKTFGLPRRLKERFAGLPRPFAAPRRRAG